MILTFEYIVLSFESEDKILWCDNSNETSMVVFSLFTIYLLYVFFSFLFSFLSFFFSHCSNKLTLEFLPLWE